MKKIAVAGIGALGSHAVLLMRNFGAKIKVIDFDRIEQKNVAAQFHAQHGVGKSKTVSFAQVMDMLFKVKVESNTNRITKDNVQVLLGGSDLVLDCLDNGESRRVIQDFVRQANIPCLHGALSADGLFGQVIWDEMFKVDDEDKAGAPTCEGGEHLPFISLVSSYLAASTQAFLAKGEKIGFQVSLGGVIRI